MLGLFGKISGGTTGNSAGGTVGNAAGRAAGHCGSGRWTPSEVDGWVSRMK